MTLTGSDRLDVLCLVLWSVIAPVELGKAVQLSVVALARIFDICLCCSCEALW